MEYQYDIFLSYRHRQLDSIITQKTFHLVEQYKLPKALREKGHDIRRAFRDTEELSVSRILTDTIDKALHSTNCLLLVCSTDTPSSEWVDREVAMFIELGRAQKIYPLLISGDPESSFPPSLKKIPDIMDRVMDVRCDGNNIKKILAKEDTALLKILADATGVDYAALHREHGLRKLRRFIAKAAAAVAVFASVGAVSFGLMHQAQVYRSRAQEAERASMSVLQELTYGLPDKLTSVPGAYSKISDILQENALQINEILLLSTDRSSAEQEVAANYEKLATAKAVMGDYDGAVAVQHQAIDLYARLNHSAALASAKNNMGKLLSSAGRYEEAAQELRQAVSLQRDVDDPVTLAAILGNVCANASEQGELTEAAESFQECCGILEGLPETYDTIQIHANAVYNFGVMCYRSGDYGSAYTHLLSAMQDYETLCSQVDSLQNRSHLLQAVSAVALVLTDEGQYEQAEEYYLRAIAAAEILAADTENAESLARLAGLNNNCGINYNMQSRFDEAASCYGQAAEQYRKLSEISNAVPDIVAFAAASMNYGDNALKAGSYPESRSAFDRGLQAYQSVEAQLTAYQLSEFYAWDAYSLMIHDKAYDAALEKAISACQVQPDSVLANMVLGYACLYAGYYEDCDRLLTAVASLGGGQADMIRLDIAAQQQAGLYSPHTDALLSLLE